MKRVVFLLCMMVFAASCTKPVDDCFVNAEDGVGLFVDGKLLLRVDEATWQTSSDLSSCTFRCTDDDLFEYYCVNLDRVPREEGEMVKGSMEWTSVHDLKRKNNVRFKVVRIDEGSSRVWLWDSSDGLGVVISVY